MKPEEESPQSRFAVGLKAGAFIQSRQLQKCFIQRKEVIL
jgi:hypothetical protein